MGVGRSAFARASFSGLPDIHRYMLTWPSNGPIFPCMAGRQPTESPHDWPISWSMDLAALCYIIVLRDHTLYFRVGTRYHLTLSYTASDNAPAQNRVWPCKTIVWHIYACRLRWKWHQLVSHGQTAIFLQDVIAFSISAHKIFLWALILKVITPCKNTAVWPREKLSVENGGLFS